MKLLKPFLLLPMLMFCAALWAQSSPVLMLETSANGILSDLKQHQASLKTNPTVISRTVERHLLPHVDVAGMSRSVLGRTAWNRATPAERAAFSKAFTQLVIRTYSSPLAEYSGETIKFAPLRTMPEGHFLRVNSVIERPNGQRIPLNYSLVQKGGDWKIYDLSVEGVSLLQSFRSQFAEVLRNESMQSLINAMQRTKKAA